MGERCEMEGGRDISVNDFLFVIPICLFVAFESMPNDFHIMFLSDCNMFSSERKRSVHAL